ncbi:MAG: LD-carboxypeptidase [Candidatus Delongbacteria bacterium]|nr:LD-carboxypeptidase [Candidatus Delongbacteria bacterium]
MGGTNQSGTTDASGIIKPRALKKGDKIGLIAPASNLEGPESVEVAADIMKWLGFEPVVGKHALDQYGYLAGQDKERAQDVNEMFKRDDVAGIFCIRGGYGTPRMLPYLDYELIRKNPKVLIGYSDITALLVAVYKMTGLVTFHGPVALSTYSDYTMEYLNRAIFSNQTIGEIKNPPTPEGKVETQNRLIRIHGGKASGRLIGGNLSLLTCLIGTPYDVDFKGKILFIEEVGEEPYDIDRMLTQFWLAGKLQSLNGIVIGKLTDVKPSDYKPSFDNTLGLEEILRTRLEPLNIPVMYGYMIGHITDKVTMPIGVMATLDADRKIFSMDENAVS